MGWCYLILLSWMGVEFVLGDSSCCLPEHILSRDGRHCLKYGAKTSLVLDCPDSVLIVNHQDLNFAVNEREQLKLLLPNREVVYEPKSFCVAQQEIFRQKKGATTRHVALICSDPYKPVIDEQVYGYCMLVSTVFLIVTAAIYATHSELRDLHGKSIVNLCVSLAFGLAILVAMKLIPYSDMNLCAARGFFAYFFILASFFWMNAVSLQVLWSLRRESKTTHTWKELAGYATYAWGIPAVLTITMAFINFMPGDHLKPGIGLNHCWFFDVKQQWRYMYSVLTVLIVVNIVIFSFATVIICTNGTPTHKKLKNKFLMCVQLLVVMGIPWIFEMVDTLTPHSLVWEILDLFNSLQGVWIFIVLVLLSHREAEEENAQYNMNITSITTEQPYYKIKY